MIEGECLSSTRERLTWIDQLYVDDWTFHHRAQIPKPCRDRNYPSEEKANRCSIVSVLCFVLSLITLKWYSRLTRNGKEIAWRIRFSFRVCSICFNLTTWTRRKRTSSQIQFQCWSVTFCLSSIFIAKKPPLLWCLTSMTRPNEP